MVTTLLFPVFALICLVTTILGPVVWVWISARAAGARAPEATRWWPVIKGIEQLGGDPATTFRARAARLVWYEVLGLGRGGGLEFSGLWVMPAGQWFYVDAILSGFERSGWTLRSAAVLPITPVRAYAALLTRPTLLAREFPKGRPADGEKRPAPPWDADDAI